MFLGFVVILLVVRANVRVIEQTQAYVVERLGTFHAVWKAGRLRFTIPLIDRVVCIVPLGEQALDLSPSEPVVTKDGVTVQIGMTVYFEVTDPEMYTYGVKDLGPAMEPFAGIALRNMAGETEQDQMLPSYGAISAKVCAVLCKTADSWGVRVNRVELKSCT